MPRTRTSKFQLTKWLAKGRSHSQVQIFNKYTEHCINTSNENHLHFFILFHLWNLPFEVHKFIWPQTSWTCAYYRVSFICLGCLIDIIHFQGGRQNNNKCVCSPTKQCSFTAFSFSTLTTKHTFRMIFSLSDDNEPYYEWILWMRKKISSKLLLY